MSDLNLLLRITALENDAIRALKNLAKQTEEMHRQNSKSNEYWHRKNNRNNEYWINKDKREQEKHEHWKTNLAAREAEKRIRIAQREEREKKQRLRQTEQDVFHSSARLGLYTTVPTGVGIAFAMRSYMELEKRQARLKMHFGKEAADMEKFAQDYALETAFSPQNTTDLLEVVALGKETLGIKSNQEIKDLTKIIGDVVLAYGVSAEERERIVDNIRQMMNMGRLELTDAKQMAKAGLNIERLAKMAGIQRKGEMWTAEEIIAIFKFAQKTEEVQTKMIENAKTFAQAWSRVGESTNTAFEGYGKTLDNQFKLTEFTKLYAGLLQKIGMSLKDDKDNLTKGMASYLTILGLTIVPTLLIFGHLKKLSFLIGESNMKLGIFKKRLFIAGSAASALYLISVDWKQVLKDIEENPMQGIIKHLDTAIALAFTLFGAFDLLNKSLLLTNARLIAIGKSPVIRMAAMGFAVYDFVSDDERIQKNIEKARGDISSNKNPSMPLENLSSSTMNPNTAEMFANFQSQPKVEVINNINVDKNDNVTIDTKTKNKDTYISPYSAPVMSNFSFGY